MVGVLVFSNKKLQKQVFPMKGRLTFFDPMVIAMRTNDLPRLAAIMRKTHEWGWGLKRLVLLLEDTSRANRMHFNADERQLAILLYRLAGPARLNALSAEKLLPSVYHSPSLARRDCIPVSHSISIEGPKAAFRPLERAAICVHTDEPSVVRKLIAGPNNTLEGVCDCAPHPIPYTCLEDLVEPLTKIQKGERHVGSYARVTFVFCCMQMISS